MYAIEVPNSACEGGGGIYTNSSSAECLEAFPWLSRECVGETLPRACVTCSVRQLHTHQEIVWEGRWGIFGVTANDS